MKNFLGSIFWASVFCLISVRLFAIYPDKEGYRYESTFADIYVGSSIGTAVTDTWGQPIEYGWKAMFQPQKFLATGLVNLNLGFRVFQDTAFIRNFRVEGETQYVFIKRKVLFARDKISSQFNTDNLPKNGQEVLKNSFALNLFYDFRSFSNILYPYAGGGVGYGEFKVIAFDLNSQPNGMGEQYTGSKTLPFTQAILGLQYDTKIIKASMFLQYKFIASLGEIALTPENDGIKFINPSNCPVSGCPTSPTTAPKTVSYVNHSLSFGFRYYLY